MRPRDIAVLVGAAFVAIAIVAFVRDPFGLRKAQVERLQAQARSAGAAAASSALEADGARATVRRVELLARTRREAEAITNQLTQAARTADDADAPLDPDRLARLRAHDVELCRLAALAGCTAAQADDAGIGD